MLACGSRIVVADSSSQFTDKTTHTLRLMWNLQWLNSRATQTQPKLLNNFTSIIFANSIRVRGARHRGASWMCPWAPRELSEVSEDRAGNIWTRFPIKQGNSDQHASCRIKTRWAAHVQNYQMNTRSWCSEGVYVFLPLRAPLKDTQVMGYI